MNEVGRWSLSPAYDINPVPEIDRARANKMPISEKLEEPTIEGALAVAQRFGLNAHSAMAILREVFVATSHWGKTGRKLGLKVSKLEAYATAFEHDLTEEARRLLRS
jgi:serine/threonine-protein kinase HipA